MSIGYGIQSVIFYVLSCSTCSKISHRHRAKAIAKREHAEKAQFESEQPGLYHHPSPFKTNPFWDEEISLGPGPPSRKGGTGKSASSSRALNPGVPSSVTSDIPHSLAPSSLAPSSPTLAASDQDSAWNSQRYQREDEELWGVDTIKAGQRLMRDALATAQSSVGSKLRAMESRLPKFSLKDEDDAALPYFVSRNPPVNDLHPPVVSSHPWQRGGMRWMLQPPPSARVMEGKEPAQGAARDASSRSRSASRGSATNSVTPSLGRQVTTRALDEKLRSGALPPLSEVEMRALSRKLSGATTLTRSQEGLARTRAERGWEESSEDEEGDGSVLPKRPVELVTKGSRAQMRPEMEGGMDEEVPPRRALVRTRTSPMGVHVETKALRRTRTEPNVLVASVDAGGVGREAGRVGSYE